MFFFPTVCKSKKFSATLILRENKSQTAIVKMTHFGAM